MPSESHRPELVSSARKSDNPLTQEALTRSRARRDVQIPPTEADGQVQAGCWLAFLWSSWQLVSHSLFQVSVGNIRLMTSSGAPSTEAGRAAGLARIAGALAGLADQTRALEQIIEEVRSGMGTSGAAIHLLDERGERFSWLVRVGVPEGVVATGGPSLELFEAFAARFDPVFSETRAEVLRADPDMKRFVDLGLQSIAIATMRVGGRLLGLVTAASYGHGRCPFEPAELAWLQTVADLVGQAVSRERALAAARDSEDRYKKIVSTIPDGVLFVDRELEIRYANPQLATMLGYRLDEILGRSAVEFMDQPWQRVFAARLEESRQGLSQRYEFRFKRKDDSELWTMVSAAPMIDSNGAFSGVLSVVGDLTARRILEMKLQHADKLESLGVMASGIAHDFNNLLVSVLGNSSLALEMLPQASRLRPLVTDIRAAAERAAELTRQMLTYSGKGRIALQSLEINRLIQESSHLLAALISKQAVLEFTLGANLPLIEGDPAQIRQVLLNLVTNASDSLGPEPGVISVGTSLLSVDRASLQTVSSDSGLAEGDYVAIEVTDSGCGMNLETKARIFDPFFTTKFTGRGLGLAAVSGIVRGHRGAIRVQSEIGSGTSFKVLLPAASPAVRRAEPETRAARGYRGQSLVLIIDDEVSVRAVAARVLETAGYRVLMAGDGEDGIQLFSQQPQAFSAVLLDLTMPGLSGVETLRQLRQLQPSIRVILSSGYNEQDVQERLHELEIAGFLHKPWIPAQLLEMLDSALLS